MMVSTRGRYALRVMIDLAEHCDGNYIPLKDVAERQDVSLKYLEKILPVLTRNELIVGVHGKGGGYKLTRRPEDYPIGEILRLTEGDLAPVACLEHNAEPCGRTAACRTKRLWNGLNKIINEYLDSVTVADLIGSEGTAVCLPLS
ncbi:MAG: RrF2 family transcriptional regulator [Oscillospiraceae bacterium]|nr:RrF2 family transcriptional regulator [Oscillospiraceae bacterium]